MNRGTLIFALVIAAPLLVLFGPVLFADRSFAMRDAGHFYYPLFEWTQSEWQAGRVPLWNPYENCGLPVLADASSSLFYPGKLVFFLPIGYTLAFNLYVVGHVLLAACGVYRLARRWEASVPAASMAGIAYALSGNVLFQYCNVVFLVGAALLPWGLDAADILLRQRNWRGGIGLALVVALMILGGDPQMAYHTLLLAGFYVLVLAWKAPAGDNVPRRFWSGRLHLGEFCRGGLLVGLVAVAAWLLAAVQVLPTSEASRLSDRAQYQRPRSIYEIPEFLSRPVAPTVSADGISAAPVGSAQQIAIGIFGKPEDNHDSRLYDFSVGPWRLPEFIWPHFGGRVFPTVRRWLNLIPAEGRIWTPSLYMGLLPVLLALAEWRWRGGDARQRWCSWLLVISILASLGSYTPVWLVKEIYIGCGGDESKFAVGTPVGGVYWLLVTFLPMYVNFRYPAKLLVISALMISLLAARGWDRLFAAPSPRWLWGLGWLRLISGVGFLVAWGVSIVLKDWKPNIPTPLGLFDPQGGFLDTMLAFGQTGVLCHLFIELLKRAWAEPDMHQRVIRWQTYALLLVMIDLTWSSYGLISTADARHWRDPPLAVELMQTSGRVQRPRVLRGPMGSWRPAEFSLKRSKQRMEETVQWEHRTLAVKHGLTAGVSGVDSYGSIARSDYKSLLTVAEQYGKKQPAMESVQRNGKTQSSDERLPASFVMKLLGIDYLLLPDTFTPVAATQIPVPADSTTWPGSTRLWRLDNALPRAWIVHQVEILPSQTRHEDSLAEAQRTRDVLFTKDATKLTPRDFRQLAIVETDQPIQPASAAISPEAAASESCRITLYEPQRVQLEVNLQSAGLVVLSDTIEKNWVATVAPLSANGQAEANQAQEVPILRTNRVMRGVSLPAGKHLLTYEYRPRGFYRGAAISALSWLLLGASFLASAALTRLKTNREIAQQPSIKSDSSVPA